MKKKLRKKIKKILQKNVSRTVAIITLSFLTITGMTYAASISTFISNPSSGDNVSVNWYSSVNNILKNITPSGSDLFLSGKITSVAIPTNNEDLVNKKYVDDEIN